MHQVFKEENIKVKGIDHQRTIFSLVHECITPMYENGFMHQVLK